VKSWAFLYRSFRSASLHLGLGNAYNGPFERRIHSSEIKYMLCGTMEDPGAWGRMASLFGLVGLYRRGGPETEDASKNSNNWICGRRTRRILPFKMLQRVCGIPLAPQLHASPGPETARCPKSRRRTGRHAGPSNQSARRRLFRGCRALWGARSEEPTLDFVDPGRILRERSRYYVTRERGSLTRQIAVHLPGPKG
jgi:hypothetical protein